MPVGMEVYLGAGHIVLDGDRAVQLPRKGHSSPPSFQPMSIAAKRPPMSATAEHLFSYGNRDDSKQLHLHL